MKPVTITGKVTPFQGNGRKLGYPTANLTTDTDLAEGIYFGSADLAEFHNKPALIFVGVPVTVGDTVRRVEVHLLDIPDVDYYDQALSVRINHFHRANKRFDGVTELLTAMRVDESEARWWFSKNPLAKSDNVGDT